MTARHTGRGAAAPRSIRSSRDYRHENAFRSLQSRRAGDGENVHAPCWRATSVRFAEPIRKTCLIVCSSSGRGLELIVEERLDLFLADVQA